MFFPIICRSTRLNGLLKTESNSCTKYLGVLICYSKTRYNSEYTQHCSERTTRLRTPNNRSAKSGMKNLINKCVQLPTQRLSNLWECKSKSYVDTITSILGYTFQILISYLYFNQSSIHSDIL